MNSLTNLFCRVWSSITTTFVYHAINFSQSTTTCHLLTFILKVRNSMVSMATYFSGGQDDLNLPVSILVPHHQGTLPKVWLQYKQWFGLRLFLIQKKTCPTLECHMLFNAGGGSCCQVNCSHFASLLCWFKAVGEFPPAQCLDGTVHCRQGSECGQILLHPRLHGHHIILEKMLLSTIFPSWNILWSHLVLGHVQKGGPARAQGEDGEEQEQHFSFTCGQRNCSLCLVSSKNDENAID